jgi:hypothetical protein
MISRLFIDYLLAKELYCPYKCHQGREHLVLVKVYIWHLKSCYYRDRYPSEYFKKGLQTLMDLLIEEMVDFDEKTIPYFYNNYLIK